MAKTNPSLTSITPKTAGERNFVDLHRDNVTEPLNKDLANNGENGMNGKSASKGVKVFDRKKFHFGNDEAQSIAAYDEHAKKIATESELSHKRHLPRRLNKKNTFVNGVEIKKKKLVHELSETYRKDQLGGIELYHTKKMGEKMDKQMWHNDDPTDPDRTGEISFHSAMRAWAARQRVNGEHVHDTNDFKGINKFSKEMQKRAREKAAKITKEDFIGMLRNEKWSSDYETPASKKGMWDGYSLEDLHKAAKSATGKRLKEIDFAIRAKTGWGKVGEGEVVSMAKYRKPLAPSKGYALNNKNKAALKSFDFAKRMGYDIPKPKAVGETETLPWLRTIAEKKLSENCIQISDRDFLAEKLARVKAIVLGEKSYAWIGHLGDRVSDVKHDKAEIIKSIKRHKEKKLLNKKIKESEEMTIDETWKYKQFPSHEEAVAARKEHFASGGGSNACRLLPNGKLAYKGELHRVASTTVPTNFIGDKKK